MENADLNEQKKQLGQFTPQLGLRGTMQLKWGSAPSRLTLRREANPPLSDILRARFRRGEKQPGRLPKKQPHRYSLERVKRKVIAGAKNKDRSGRKKIKRKVNRRRR
jgi:hypothetical protein